MKELKYLQEMVKKIKSLYHAYEDIQTLIEMGYEENDPEIAREAQADMEKFEEAYEELRIQTLLSGEYDTCNAIVTIHAGAGGTESCDWAGMLYRMYTRWAERKGFQIQVLDFLDGDIAGIKAITFEVSGENAYGYLKSEKGVHRGPAGPEASTSTRRLPPSGSPICLQGSWCSARMKDPSITTRKRPCRC